MCLNLTLRDRRNIFFTVIAEETKLNELTNSLVVFTNLFHYIFLNLGSWKKKLLIGPNRFFSQFASRKRNRNKFSLKKSEDSKFEIGEYFIWWILCMIQLQHSANIFGKKSKRKQSHNVQDHSSSQRYFWENLLQSRWKVWKSEGANSNPRPSPFWRRSFCFYSYQNLEGQLSPSQVPTALC